MIAEDWQRLRASDGVVLLDGFHAVKHALRFGAEVLSVVTADRPAALALATTLAPDLAATLGARLVEVDAVTFAWLSGPTAGSTDTSTAGATAGSDRRPDARTGGHRTGGHRTGVAALARRAPWSLGQLASAQRSSPLVFLDDPRHLGNYGAVVRVAAGLGAAGVVSTGTVDPWHPAVLRGAAGLHFAVPVLRVEAGVDAVDGPLIAFDAAGVDASAATIPGKAVLAFGSERHGLSSQVRARADELLALPMRPGVASYNLASAVAMVLYQWLLGAGGRRVPAAAPQHEPQP